MEQGGFTCMKMILDTDITLHVNTYTCVSIALNTVSNEKFVEHCTILILALFLYIWH